MSKIDVTGPTKLPKQLHPRDTFLLLDNGLDHAEDPDSVHEVTLSILDYMQQAEGEYFEASLQLMTKLMAKGYSNFLTESTGLLEKVMQLFVKLSKRYNQNNNKDSLYRMLFVLSILAELLRNEPKFLLPFNRDFLFSICQMRAESLQSVAQKSQFLTILGVLFSNISKQAKLLRELKGSKVLKEALLQNYSQIFEESTQKVFNQSILQLQLKGGAYFTLCDLERYSIKQKLVRLLAIDDSSRLDQYLLRIFPISKNGKIRS